MEKELNAPRAGKSAKEVHGLVGTLAPLPSASRSGRR